VSRAVSSGTVCFVWFLCINYVPELSGVVPEAFPRFAEPIPNVTVTVGRDALLACVVDNLRAFKVSGVGVDGLL
jgi:hypothetical protein